MEAQRKAEFSYKTMPRRENISGLKIWKENSVDDYPQLHLGSVRETAISTPDFLRCVLSPRPSGELLPRTLVFHAVRKHPHQSIYEQELEIKKTQAQIKLSPDSHANLKFMHEIVFRFSGSPVWFSASPDSTNVLIVSIYCSWALCTA